MKASWGEGLLVGAEKRTYQGGQRGLRAPSLSGQLGIVGYVLPGSWRKEDMEQVLPWITVLWLGFKEDHF